MARRTGLLGLLFLTDRTGRLFVDRNDIVLRGQGGEVTQHAGFHTAKQM